MDTIVDNGKVKLEEISNISFQGGMTDEEIFNKILDKKEYEEFPLVPYRDGVMTLLKEKGLEGVAKRHPYSANPRERLTMYINTYNRMRPQTYFGKMNKILIEIQNNGATRENIYNLADVLRSVVGITLDKQDEYTADLVRFGEESKRREARLKEEKK